MTTLIKKYFLFSSNTRQLGIRVHKLFLLSFFIFFASLIHAQESFPGFTLNELGPEKTQISWLNPFPNCVQITVQRSYDSLKNYQTIFSPQSPELNANGFVDNTKLVHRKAYYRISYVLQGGKYYFTGIKSAGINSLMTQQQDTLRVNFSKINFHPLNFKEEYYIYKETITDTTVKILDFGKFIKFKDSVIYKSRDTLLGLASNLLVWRSYVPSIFSSDYGGKNLPPNAPIPSNSYVYYSGNRKYIIVNIPDSVYGKYKYGITFFDERGVEIFKIKKIKSRQLILDNVNFIHSGWFNYILYEDEKLKRREDIYINP